MFMESRKLLQPYAVFGDMLIFKTCLIGFKDLFPIARYTYVVILYSIVFFTQLNAQTPGGGGTSGLKLWLKADAGVTTSGLNVSTWASQTTGTITTDAAKTATGNVTKVSNAMNFNPVVRFDGSGSQTLKGVAANTFSGLGEIFVAAKNSASTNSYSGMFATGNTGSATQGGQGLIFDATSSIFFIDGSGANSNGSNTSVVTTTAPTAAHVLTGKYAASSTSTYASYLNVDAINNNSYLGVSAASVTSNTNFEIGGRTAGSGSLASNVNRVFNGDIAEVVYYVAPNGTGLLAATIQQVQSYLAIKYGITLGTNASAVNYTSSAGTTIWALSATYQNDVFGVGIDNGFGLSQLKSNSMNSGSGDGTGQSGLGNIVVDATTAIAATGNFFMIGRNTSALSNQTTDLPSGIASRLARVWRVQETGTGVSTITLSFDLTGLGIVGSAYNLRMLVNTGTTFATGTTTVSPASVNGNIVSFSYDFTGSASGATTYFTFGTVSVYPGNVSSPTLWLKANSNTSTTTQSASISSWIDNIASYSFQNATTSKQPTYSNLTSDNTNYNPTVKFTSSSLQYLKTPVDYVSNQFCNVSAAGIAVGTILGSGVLATNKSGNMFTHWTYNGVSPWTAALGIQYPASTLYVAGGIPHAGTSSAATTSGYSNVYEDDRLSGTASSAYTLNTRANGKMSTISISGFSSVPASSSVYVGVADPNAPTDPLYWNGGISEVIIYNTQLSGANLVKVQSYLAIKYGVTLDSLGLKTDNGTAAYVNTAGTSIYLGGGTGSSYWNNIIGIGRDDAEGLQQRQSHQQDDSVRLYLGTAIATSNIANSNNFFSDNNYVMMGSNTGKLCSNAATASEMPATLLTSGGSRLDREWKVICTNYTGKFSIDITLSCSIGNDDQLVLLVDDDGNFTNAQVVSQPSVTITYNRSSRLVTVNNLNTTLLNNGTAATNLTKYITLATTTFQILPVTLVSFTATQEKKSVLLDWTTAAEMNASYFEIQRSANAVVWETIGKIIANGNSSSASTYHSSDATPLDGINYYRLKLVDKNGKYTYSVTRTAKFGKDYEAYTIYPNPVKNEIMVTWKDVASYKPKHIMLYNMDGTLLPVTYRVDDNKAVVNVSSLPAAAYFIRLVSDKHTTQQLILKY